MATVPELDTIDTLTVQSPHSGMINNSLISSKVEVKMPGQQGAPTPVLPRRKFLPRFSTYVSIPQSGSPSHKSQLQKTVRVFTKRGNQWKNALNAKSNRLVAAETNFALSTPSSNHGSVQAYPSVRRRRDLNSWTMKVSKLDIMKLRHELDTESVREKVEGFQKEISLKNEEMLNSMS